MAALEVSFFCYNKKLWPKATILIGKKKN